MDSLDREIADAFAEQAPTSGPGQILIVGGTADFQRMLEAKLTDAGNQCDSVDRRDGALKAIARNRYDLVLLHAALPEQMRALPQLPEMEEIHEPKHKGALGPVVADWRPDDEEFWRSTGRRIAQRNLCARRCLYRKFRQPDFGIAHIVRVTQVHRVTLQAFDRLGNVHATDSGANHFLYVSNIEPVA